jgi:hypothetical protein
VASDEFWSNFDMTNDDDVAEAICEAFAAWLVNLARTEPERFSDAITGFVADRVGFFVANRAVTIVERQEDGGYTLN